MVKKFKSTFDDEDDFEFKSEVKAQNKIEASIVEAPKVQETGRRKHDFIQNKE